MDIITNIFQTIMKDKNLEPIRRNFFHEIEKLIDEFIYTTDISDKIISNIKNIDTHSLLDVRYHNLYKLSGKKGHIIISNHSTFCDLSVVCNVIDCYCIMRNMLKKSITTEELFNKYKLINYDKTKENGIIVKEQILNLLNTENNVLVFPEGKFSVNKNTLLPFKKGLFHLAYENNIPIIPIIQTHHNFNGDGYFVSHIQNVILGIPITDLNVDVIIQDVITPSEFKTFGEFYNHVVELYSKEFNENNKY
jgi:1-acyl-sn-glycerol-3-phosphate acyltransferase